MDEVKKVKLNTSIFLIITFGISIWLVLNHPFIFVGILIILYSIFQLTVLFKNINNVVEVKIDKKNVEEYLKEKMEEN